MLSFNPLQSVYKHTLTKNGTQFTFQRRLYVCQINDIICDRQILIWYLFPAFISDLACQAAIHRIL